MIERIKDNKKIMPIITVFLIILVVVGITYAWLVQRSEGSDNKINLTASTGLELELTDEEDAISIVNGVPMSDGQGLATTSYKFKVKNKGQKADYTLYLDDVEIEGDRIPDANIKYSLTRNGGNDVATPLVNTHKTENNQTVRELDHTIIGEGTTQTPVVNTYTLKVWIDSEATTSISGKVFKAKVRLEGVQTEDSLEDTYEVSGTLYDDNNQPVQNGVVAVYSNPLYTTTDSEGKFTVKGLEFGTHDIYYVPGKTLNEVQEMSKSQIEGVSGVGKGSISTTSISSTISLSNGYDIRNAIKEKSFNNSIIGSIQNIKNSGVNTITASDKEYSADIVYVNGNLNLTSDGAAANGISNLSFANGTYTVGNENDCATSLTTAGMQKIQLF